ncbi:MAG: outer membrane protein assembly factor BamD [Bdellovibrionaceae bacterium]|nr:outer membrane protein assembly factor BamD [Bdellovibrionales bacterium]MCB9085523.1 outer membrane protein assembly factor BamD [Pseudobdellovibrionaceae bacterium]
MKTLSWFTALLALALVSSCSTSEKIDANTAEGSFEYAQRFEKDERYEEAIAQYMDVKNKHPYSKLALEAELRVADIHYKRESYIESQSAYQIFKDFHPRHPKIDYVTFRLAMSYYNQLPETIDRDLSLAGKAILYFNEVIQSFPRSEFVTKANEHKTACLKKLANKELYIADFYFSRDQFDSALGRFEDLLAEYPNLGYEPRALYGAAFSSFKLKDLPKARSLYDRLISQHPDSSEAKKLKDEIGNELQR